MVTGSQINNGATRIRIPPMPIKTVFDLIDVLMEAVKEGKGNCPVYVDVVADEGDISCWSLKTAYNWNDGSSNPGQDDHLHVVLDEIVMG